jgi:hypothetical protein
MNRRVLMNSPESAVKYSPQGSKIILSTRLFGKKHAADNTWNLLRRFLPGGHPDAGVLLTY